MAGAAQLEGEKTGWRLCKRIENVCCDKKKKKKNPDFCVCSEDKKK